MNEALILKPFLAVAAFLWILTAICAARKPALAKRAMTVAWVLNLCVFIFNCSLAQAPAFGNMFHVMVVLPLFLPLFLWYARVFLGYHNLLPYIAGLAAFILIGTLSMDTQRDWRQMPALQSPWFVPHVSSYLVSYALMGVATLLAVRSYFGKAAVKAAIMEEATTLVRLAFAFLTFGLCSGALWANEAWGGYWSWDMKEVWALITWSLYLIFFHLEKPSRFGQTGRALLILAFIALLFTFFVVNYLPSIQSMHSYAS